MIKIEIVRTAGGQIAEASVSGHADSAEYGSDIVCASVSVLAINTINALTELADAELSYYADEGDLHFVVNNKLEDKSVQILLQAMELGFESIRSEYPTYITIVRKEG